MVLRVAVVAALLLLGLGCAGFGQAGSPVTLVSLEAGDVVCYVTVDDGEEHIYDGDFDLCEGCADDASALVGTRVLLSFDKSTTRADLCAGVRNCTDNQEIDLVVAIHASGG